MSIKTDSAYVIEGSDLKQLAACLTEINELSSRELDASLLKEVFSCVKKAQGHMDAAVYAPGLTLSKAANDCHS